jgi:hypothetical protein
MATLERLFRSSPKSDVALVLRVELALKPARHYGRFQGVRTGTIEAFVARRQS